ncbi:hypothetical protein F5887DRAFT_920937 [Amanita rubescens]|nr:hypothetical protein F5887DRAFT_929481 [Amanita rubescens]KAF8336146.1 hypothetical protein F5887DRAFT_920937 [Amanita rubescens]
MAPTKRKRSKVKQVKTPLVIPETDIISELSDVVEDKFVVNAGEDDSDVPLARVSSVKTDVTKPVQITNTSTHDTDETDEDAVVNVKKPRRFNVQSDSDSAKPIQTARPARGKPRINSHSLTTQINSDAVPVEGGSVMDVKKSDISDQTEGHLSSDTNSVNSNDSGDDLDAIQTKVSTIDSAKETETVYLDSFPEITDSGVARNKQIQNNPLILEDEDIDPLLRDEHKTLPTLRRVSNLTNSSVIQFVRYGQPQPEPGSNVALGYEKVIQKMVTGSEGKRQLTSAVNFTHSLPFLNPSRASPNLVVFDAGKICFKGENSKLGKNAVFITTGLIVESQLKDATDSTINAGHKIRQVILLPFAGEVQRLFAYIGTVFETDEYVCLLDSGSLILTTRREGAGADYNNYVNSPSSSSSPARTRVPAGLLTSSPVKIGSSRNQNKGKSTHFAPSLGFKDRVPVYDARRRPTFMFDKDGLKHVSDLPIYKIDKTEIPPCKYIATVGYTVGSWKTRASADDETIRSCASLNIQFVIILGKVDVKDLA